jgi:hypothetical protein
VLVFGCETGQKHDFGEVRSIYSANATTAFSGGIVREWFDDSSTGANLGRQDDHLFKIKYRSKPVVIGLVDIRRGDEVLTRPGYQSLSSQLSVAQPTSTSITAYTPTNTPEPTCKLVTVTNVAKNAGNFTTNTFAVATPLPFQPFPPLCSCMMNTLTCTAASGWNYTTSQTTWSSICSNSTTSSLCLGVETQPDTGIIGSYAGCNITEQVSWALDQLYITKGRDASTCTSLGGIIQEPVTNTAPGGHCAVLLKQVGPDALGSVSVTPTATSEPSLVKNGSNMSTKARIGLGVGLSVFVIVLFSISSTLCMWSRRRKRATKAVKETEDSQDAEKGVEEQSSAALNNFELEGQERKELDGGEIIGELDIRERAELVGDDVGEIDGNDNFERLYELEGSSPPKNENLDMSLEKLKEGKRVEKS